MKRGWFGPKTLGYGVGPRTWQGWLVTLACTVATLAGVKWLAPAIAEGMGLRVGLVMAIVGVVPVLALLAIMALTYDERR